jgi:pyrroloquinoline quinone (PQQ) biosynthesis protein C
MQEADKIISSRGDVLHGDMNFREKLAQALGFSPAELRDYYSTSKKAYEASQGWEDDAEQWYKTMSGVLARRGLTIQDMDFHSKVFGEFSRVFGNDNPRFLNWIKNRLRKDNNDGQNNLALNIMHDLWGIVTPNEQRDMLRNSGAPQEVIDAGLRVIDLQEEFEQKRKKDNNG